MGFHTLRADYTCCPLSFCSKSACLRPTSGRASSGRWPRSTRTETKPRSWPTSDATNLTLTSLSSTLHHLIAHYTTLPEELRCSPLSGFQLFPPTTTWIGLRRFAELERIEKRSFRQVFRCVFKCVFRVVGTMNVTCSSSSTETTAKWFESVTDGGIQGSDFQHRCDF